MMVLEESTLMQYLKDQYDGTEILAIKNTFIRHVGTLIALKSTARLFKLDGACVPISKNFEEHINSLWASVNGASKHPLAQDTSFSMDSRE